MEAYLFSWNALLPFERSWENVLAPSFDLFAINNLYGTFAMQLNSEKSNVTGNGCYPFVVCRPLKAQLAHSADPDQTPQNAASDQCLHCLQIVQQFFSRNI